MSEEHHSMGIARQRLARVLARSAGGDPIGLSGAVRSRPGAPPESGKPPEALAPPEPPAPEDAAVRAPGGVLARLGGSAFDPGRPGLRALAAVAAVVVLGAAVLAWWSRPRPEPVPPLLPATAAPVASPAGSAGPPELVVAVSGKVHEPGLVELPPGSRVADAVEAAGGLLPGAEVDHLNLARKVVDGELIAVGIPPPPGPAGGPAGSGPAAPGSGAKVNLNTAMIAELDTLPGIGPALAQRIVDHRTTQGSFGSVGELREVAGIGEVRFAELRELVTV